MIDTVVLDENTSNTQTCINGAQFVVRLLNLGDWPGVWFCIDISIWRYHAGMGWSKGRGPCSGSPRTAPGSDSDPSSSAAERNRQHVQHPLSRAVDQLRSFGRCHLTAKRVRHRHASRSKVPARTERNIPGRSRDVAVLTTHISHSSNQTDVSSPLVLAPSQHWTKRGGMLSTTGNGCRVT